MDIFPYTLTLHGQQWKDLWGGGKGELDLAHRVSVLGLLSILLIIFATTTLVPKEDVDIAIFGTQAQLRPS